MRGLTGGSWKRSADLTRVIEKNSLGGKPHGLKWLHDLPSTDPTAPAPDPPLATLFAAMAADKEYLGDIARRVVLASLTDPDTITYRQGVLTDCLQHPAVVRQLYDLAVEALRSLKKVWFSPLFRDSPDIILRRSVEILELLIDSLHQLRSLAHEHGRQFRSEGFVRFFAMVCEELDDEYLASIEAYLTDLRLPDGMLMTAELGQGNKGRAPLAAPPAAVGARNCAHPMRPADTHRSGRRTVWVPRTLSCHATWTYSQMRPLHIFVDEVAQSVSSERPDGRLGTWGSGARGRVLMQ